MVKWGSKDGGPESKVTMYGIEIKWLFSILLLRFARGTREAFHGHAFNSKSWVLSGGLWEIMRDKTYAWHWPSFKPVTTLRNTIHKVYGQREANWVLSLRGPWAKTWVDIVDDKVKILTHGRIEV